MIIRESKRNLMKMRTNFHKFCVNSRTIDIKYLNAILINFKPFMPLNAVQGLIFSACTVTLIHHVIDYGLERIVFNHIIRKQLMGGLHEV